MTKQEFLKLCWKHYLVLEADFMEIERYITFEEGNLKCYSVELIKQYQAICSEIDVVCKIFCKVLNTNSNAKNVLSYAYEILGAVPDIKNAVVECNDMELEPLKEWSTNPQNHKDGNDPLNDSPKWWRMYNKVKHERIELDDNGEPYYKQANLENTINALAALFVLCMNCYKSMCEQTDIIKVPHIPSKLFKYKDWETHVTVSSDGSCSFTY